MALQKSLPWTKSPLIINAPMGGFAVPKLSIAVSQAGGVGLIGALNDATVISNQLAECEASLDRVNGLLPIGVGLLVFITKIDDVLPVLEKFQPAIVWLFAAHEHEHYGQWAKKIRDKLPKTQIWIQLSSVKAALEVAECARPDALSIQGSDAGGHGADQGAGIVALLPEISDALEKKGYGDIALIAAGGIADGRGAAAALALGAQGVLLGTRFLSARETAVHPEYQQAILRAKDGGQSTIRSKLFDNLAGPNVWPSTYDGRSIIVQSFVEHQEGKDIEEIRKLHNAAKKEDHAGFHAEGEGRAAIWAGAGVGLVTRLQSAAEIVEEVRSTAIKVLKGAAANL